MATRIPTSKRASGNGSARIPKNVIDKHKRQIPERLATIRATRAQRSFARELGVFQQNVNRYENGTTPHADFLITLAVQEGISLDWLLLGRGQPRHRNESRR